MMKRRSFRPLASLVTAMAIAAAGLHLPAAAQGISAMATQSTVERGVTVKVTPKAVSGPDWEFAVVLDTHAEDLKDDLRKTSVLIVNGREIQPTAWAGPGAGGHHREGVLSFPAPETARGSFELRIQRAGEVDPRVFRWDSASTK